MTTFEEYAASRPKPWLPARRKRGSIETLFIEMQAHDWRGNTWTRDIIGAYLVRLPGGDTGQNDD